MDAMPSERALKELVQLFKLLADETRLGILFTLRQTEEMNVLELCRALQLRQPSVSHHLALLRVAGLIAMRREGKHNYYRILPERLKGLIESYFDQSAGRGMRLCFEQFELLLTPTSSPS